MIPRSIGKKIAFGFAVGSFVSSAISLAIFVYLLTTRGMGDVITASLMATTLFFMSCGVVLSVMGQPQKHKLEPWDSLDKAE